MKISVIIPVYNSEKYLGKCLDSILAQTCNNWEAIAIDDGSQDKSFSILSQYALNDSRFKVVSQDNQGPGKTRNKAILMADGDYIVFIDSDDYVEKRYFEDLFQCITKKNADVVFINVRQEKPNGKLIKYETFSQYVNCPLDKLIRHQLTGKLPWGGCRKVVKRSLLVANDIQYSSELVGEEALFSLRILLCAKKVAFLDKIHYHYVNYPNSQSKKGADDPWGSVCRTIRGYLMENQLYNEYKTTVNSFAYTALIASIYRIACNYNFKESVNKSKDALKRFAEQYRFDLDEDSLELRTKCMLPLVKRGYVFPVIVTAKLKKIVDHK